MDWNELLMTLIKVVILPAVPIVVGAVVKLCKAKTDEALTDVENETLRQALNEATDAVYAAVTYTSQVYVDTLKQNGNFSKEAQAQALKTALEKAEAMLAEDTKKLLESLYGNLEDWLTVKIEQAVREQKIA